MELYTFFIVHEADPITLTLLILSETELKRKKKKKRKRKIRRSNGLLKYKSIHHYLVIVFVLTDDERPHRCASNQTQTHIHIVFHVYSVKL